MGSVEKITEKILADARSFAEETKRQSESDALALQQEYAEKAKARTDALVHAAQSSRDADLTRAKSAAALLARSRVLEEKTRLIEDCITTLTQTLAAGYATEYRALFVRLFRDAVQDSDGEVVFAADDADAPSVFEELSAAQQKRFPNRTLKMVRSDALSRGGFLVRFGRISVPCTAQELVDYYRPMLTARANEVLFEGTGE